MTHSRVDRIVAIVLAVLMLVIACASIYGTFTVTEYAGRVLTSICAVLALFLTPFFGAVAYYSGE